jgi:hypothetical protein
MKETVKVSETLWLENPQELGKFPVIIPRFYGIDLGLRPMTGFVIKF